MPCDYQSFVSIAPLFCRLDGKVEICKSAVSLIRGCFFCILQTIGYAITTSSRRVTCLVYKLSNLRKEWEETRAIYITYIKTTFFCLVVFFLIGIDDVVKLSPSPVEDNQSVQRVSSV